MGEAWATIEQAVQIRHLLGIEWWQVKMGEPWATTEHAAHIRHILSIEIIYAFYCLKFIKI